MSVYISNLPLYTGNTYNGYVIWNDSGETTTYKVKNYSPYNNGSAINSVVSNYYDASSVLSTNSQILGGSGNSIASTDASGRNTIIGGEGNTIPTGFGNAIINGSTATISGNIATIIGASGSISDGFGNILLGGVGIVGGNNSGIVAGYGNIIHPTFNERCFISGGQSNQILYGENCSVIGGIGNIIQGAATNSSIIGGQSNTITGGTNQVMLGCSGRTTNYSNTTYVENLHTYRTPSTRVQSVSSGTTFTCNLELGAKSQFYLTGTSTINITNVRDGASFMIKTQTDGNYNITWTATGYTFVFAGGIKDPGNITTDIFVFEVFGSVIYGNRRHNYS
jgi:hypothetical protein